MCQVYVRCVHVNGVSSVCPVCVKFVQSVSSVCQVGEEFVNWVKRLSNGYLVSQV